MAGAGTLRCRRAWALSYIGAAGLAGVFPPCGLTWRCLGFLLPWLQTLLMHVNSVAPGTWHSRVHGSC